MIAFLENPLFVLFPGFGGPRNTLWKFFSYCHFHTASKENFLHGFKSAILAKMKNCQNGTFEAVHEI